MSDPTDTRRTAKTALTWVRKAVFRLQADGESRHESVRWLTGYEAESLLSALLDELELLVPLLNADSGYEAEQAERRAKALARMLRDRRLAMAMDNTAGRTQEEAAAFEAKARELRGPSDRA